jgi:SAM-dependent methyltransferase
MPATNPSARALLREDYRDATNLDARTRLYDCYSTNPLGWYAWVFKQLRLKPHARVLDIGCGAGRLWADNRDRIPHGFRVTLADFSPGMARDACEKLGAIAAHVTFALYHVPDRPQAYAEMCRVLASNGRFFASANGRDSMRVYDELIALFRPPVTKPHPRTNDSGQTSGFNLEHGAEEFAAYFAHVTLHRFDDAIVVPEAQPLAAFAEVSGHLSGEALARFTQHVDALIAQHGPLRIEKDVGMFEASR